ncbi:membrane-targeted effector domain-containing toxin [Pseudomonas syringae]|uniref:membrane-targeted effector domain-containing toxin n=1 Tax=Pseudomonas TaxID=286 RepID=UPI0003F573F6|nr:MULTISPECIES: membrane-targeted effector domain-containing toxin [Pseudomonas]MCH5532895.1 membrane-targeted effector domain-containing toxin [Pseudomonas syringae pv. syringae]MCH5556699.1 membrane-targeted effector domain-containing toxin [Pseudomonas syringae pv. syringae]MCH5576995.1 membrane-targeted effector domain-containing toxin [Pseudomonas syringae pv. syringae]MCH5669090.1 membrane-targeted effector domain-containing toxin [Pseudomonas syringae pv. syringae]MDF5776922.1 membrane
MRPVGGPAPIYYPPAPEIERSVARSAPKELSQSSQASSSGTSSESADTPKLGKIRHYAAGRYAHLAEAIVNMKVSDHEQADDKDAGRERKSERKSRAGNSTAVRGKQNAGSSSRSSDSKFRASSLAELASWSENTHSYSMAPASMFKGMPVSAIDRFVNDAKKTLGEGLSEVGVKLDDVIVSQSRQTINVNLNYIEMNEYLGRDQNMWIQPDRNNAGKKLHAKATLYFSDFSAQDKPPLGPLSKLKSKESLGVMRELLSDSPGLVIGEAHSSVASKRELIKNMKSLKADGVTTLYMEHLCADSHGKALDDYLKAPEGSPMPARLKAYLDMQTRGNLGIGKVASEYNFTTLIRAAKDAGLHVVPLDTAKTYETSLEGGETRFKVMNYYAAEKIRLDQPAGKWVAFVGSGHAATCDGVPGLAQLHGVRSLIIDDFGAKSRPDININAKKYADKINPDVVLSYKV